MFVIRRSCNYTASSGVSCSAGGSLRLYAAHSISFDFFKVSSILQAAKSAAAAASCPIVREGSQKREHN